MADEYIEVVPRMREVDANRALAKWFREHNLLETALEPREIAQELITDGQGRNLAIYRIRRSAFERLGIDIPPTWTDVPLEAAARWRQIFDASSEGLDVTAPCPICGEATLHRWFWLFRPAPSAEAGRHWQGKGSQWQWCASCGSFEHSSGLVPDWWHSELAVDPTALTADPGPIEAARMAR